MWRYFPVRRGEKKKDRKQWKGTKGIVGRLRKVKCLLLHSERMSKPWWGFLPRCLSWWPQAHESPGCRATFLSVWMEGCPPTSQTFSLWGFSELPDQANVTHTHPFISRNYIFEIFFSFCLIVLYIYIIIFFYFRTLFPSLHCLPSSVGSLPMSLCREKNSLGSNKTKQSHKAKSSADIYV